MAKAERLRFTINNDLSLLREVVATNPFGDETRWNRVLVSIQAITNKNFSLRLIKEHVDHLLRLFTKEDLANLRKSGTEEEYTEKERLLQEIIDLRREFKPLKVVKTNLCHQKGKELRENSSQNAAFLQDQRFEVAFANWDIPEERKEPIIVAAGAVHDSPVTSRTTSRESTPTAFRAHKRSSSGTLKTNTLKLLQDRQLMEQQLKEREFALQERKIDLEERRLKLEEEKLLLQKADHVARLELEKKEREGKLAMELKERAQQHRIIELLLKRFSTE